MAALADALDIDALSRLLDEIEALKEIFQDGFVIVDSKKFEMVSSIYKSLEDSAVTQFSFSMLEDTLRHINLKLVSKLSIAEDLPSCTVEIMLNVPVNYIIPLDSYIKVLGISCSDVTADEKLRITNVMQEIANNARDEEVLYEIFQTGIDKCTELVENTRKTRLMLQKEAMQHKLKLEERYRQSVKPVLGRRILFSHHIIADSKRSAVCNWAADLALGGFSKIGWPGLILVEGEEENCKIYVQSLQRCEYLTFRLVTNFLQLL